MYERITEASSVSLPIQSHRQYQFLFTATALFSPTHTLKFLQNAQREKKKIKKNPTNLSSSFYQESYF